MSVVSELLSDEVFINDTHFLNFSFSLFPFLNVPLTGPTKDFLITKIDRHAIYFAISRKPVTLGEFTKPLRDT